MSATAIAFTVVGIGLVVWMAYRAVADPEADEVVARAISTGKVEEEAKRLVEAGRLALAVRLLREAHGLTPRQAMDLVATMDPEMAQQRARHREEP